VHNRRQRVKIQVEVDRVQQLRAAAAAALVRQGNALNYTCQRQHVLRHDCGRGCAGVARGLVAAASRLACRPL
jgi:hypothetical protein